MNRIFIGAFAVLSIISAGAGIASADHPAHPLSHPWAHNHDADADDTTFPPGFGPFGAPLGDTAGSSEHGQGTGREGWR